jgi:hypothetical protein
MYVKTFFSYTLALGLLFAVSWMVYDLLFDKPLVHEGVIVKMDHIPGKVQSGQYHLGSRSRPQLISATSRDLWVATVKMEDGTLTKVDCKKHHFDNKEIGSVLRFKEFPGGSLEIKYFSHNDEAE